MAKSRLLHNRYKWEKMLGQGGMGKVYLMTDLRTQKQVAVKECCCPQEDNVAERIKREYYFMTKIQHPHLIRGLDFFQIQNRYFIVMEYVQGITLCDFVRHHPKSISLEKQLQIMMQICDAVATLNRSGIVHRDIKPENIILTPPDLAPKLLDFGIAKAINGELATITKTDNIIGTPDYMTPEQIDRSIKSYENLDVFSLGIVFYQFLAWLPESPFSTGRIVSTIDRIMHYELPPVFAKTKDNKQQRISQIISGALRKDPSERIESVHMLKKLLGDESLKICATKKQDSAIENDAKTPWKLSRNLRIAFWIVINSILLIMLTLGKPVRQITTIKEELVSTHKTDPTQLLKYYGREVKTQKGSRQKWAYAKRSNLLYQMRQLKKDNMKKALQDAQKMERVKSRIFLVRVHVLELILKTKEQDNQQVKKLAARILQESALLKNKHLGFADRRFIKCAENIARHCLENTPRNTLLNTGYGDLYLCCSASQLGQKIVFLHQAQLLIPHEERVYLELLDVYIACGFFDKAQETYDLLKKMNNSLVEMDFLMAKKHLAVGEFHKVKETFRKWKTNVWQKQTSWVQVLRIKYLLATNNQELAKRVMQSIDRKQLTTKQQATVELLKNYEHSQMTFAGHLALADIWIELSFFPQAQELLKKIQQLLHDTKENEANRSFQRLKCLCALQELRFMVKKIMSTHRVDAQTMKKIKRKIKAISDVGRPIDLLKILTVANFRIWCLQNNVDNMPVLDEQRLKEIVDNYAFFYIKAREYYYKGEYATAILYWDKANDIIPSVHFKNMQKRAFAKLTESKNNETRYAK
ncbi:serine/threonine-protein kinase [Candidatus Uabimicrobium amorphum]|uniref:Serine/threonine protein kinase n=1 Tax=Uabimicrobium amorphum TaxID=2596890 RepID=A0A5S9F2G8_UABAM|nr:serine/threonine-protein kinase [Candidatus Uabimicrobium amorphum]BBM82384.1 serine/threonine protein kinase [Candidatus Uabimicrobium amorphum]